MTFVRRVLFASCFLVVASCRSERASTPAASVVPDRAPASTQTSGIDASKPMPAGLDETAMNPQVNPCDDFYEYACGGWMQRTEIPPDRSRYSRGFIAIQDRNELLLKDILEQAAAGKGDTPYTQQLGDYWATCMDVAKMESVLPEVQAELKRVANVKDAASLSKLVARWHARGVFPFFDIDSIQDFKDSTVYVYNVDQGGLGLPDRDYYLKEDPKMRSVRDAYAAHVAKFFQLYGQSEAVAKKSSDAVLALETQLARASLDKVQRRDPKLLYNRLDRGGLQKKAPRFIWDSYFRELGFPSAQAINVSAPLFVEELDKVIASKQVAVWRTYLTWVLLRESVSALPKRFQDEEFRYTSQALTGAKEDRPRWKKCVEYASEHLGEAVGQGFVARTFPPEAKSTTLKMVHFVERAFEENLAGLAWMDEPTKARALGKVKKIANKIGYPDQWRDYSSYKTVRTSYLSNVLAANAFELRRRLSRVGKPVDPNEWHMPPQTVNAYYDGSKNEICFLAGILQPPFFDPKAAASVNLGATGMVVGHEITHGFDDEGRQFDEAGNLKDWWTETSAKAFVERAACVKNQFDNYVAIEEVKVNGALTLGENVADLGGLKLAHAAMLNWLKESPPASGQRYTPSQEFFLGYAQSWCTKYRPELARVRAQTDPHAPPHLRVNGPLTNLPAFHEAFGCKAGSKMVRAPRCEVW